MRVHPLARDVGQIVESSAVRPAGDGSRKSISDRVAGAANDKFRKGNVFCLYRCLVPLGRPWLPPCGHALRVWARPNKQLDAPGRAAESPDTSGVPLSGSGGGALPEPVNSPFEQRRSESWLRIQLGKKISERPPNRKSVGAADKKGGRSNGEGQSDSKEGSAGLSAGGVSRRTVLKAGAAALATSTIFKPAILRAADDVIRIGHVSPVTGPMAGFAEAQDWSLGGIRKLLEPGLEIAGKTYKVEIITKDSQTDESRTAEVANQLILKDKVHIITASSGSIDCNPVANVAELNEVPCVTTDDPWES